MFFFIRVLFFSLVLAHLCDQRKWEDEIQDLKGGMGLQKGQRHMRHVAASLDSFLDAIHCQLLLS